MSITGSPSASVLHVSASQVTILDISLDTFRPCLSRFSFPSEACDRFYIGRGTFYMSIPSQPPTANDCCNILNTKRLIQNGRHLADDIFKYIFNFVNENVWVSIKISLKYVPNYSINNIPALVHMMAWRWPGDKPLSEPVMVSLLTHIWVTRPQWVNAKILE